MAKVLISLLGGQPAPVYMGLVGIKPEKSVIIFSEQSEKNVSLLEREFPEIVSAKIKLSPTNPVEILAMANALVKQYAEDEIYVNISSGTKAWTHIFGYIFQALENAHVIYVDQNNVLWDYKDNSNKGVVAFDMKALFRMYGNPIDGHYTPFADYTTEDQNTLSIIQKARRYDIGIFERLINPKVKADAAKLKTFSGQFEVDGLSSVQWERAIGEQPGWFRINILKRNGKSNEFFSESPHAPQLLFNTAWFEYKVAVILSHWSNAQEICMNCRFPSRKGVDKNEVDIVVNTGVKLLFVECKLQIVSPTDIDKFRSVVKNYGSMGAKGIFITDQPINDTCVQKCEENQLLHFSLSDKGDNVNRLLFEYIDRYINTINMR